MDAHMSYFGTKKKYLTLLSIITILLCFFFLFILVPFPYIHTTYIPEQVQLNTLSMCCPVFVFLSHRYSVSLFLSFWSLSHSSSLAPFVVLFSFLSSRLTFLYLSLLTFVSFVCPFFSLFFHLFILFPPPLLSFFHFSFVVPNSFFSHSNTLYWHER